MDAKKNVIFLLAEGFEEVEVVTPWDILKRAGANVLLLSVGGEKFVKGAHGLLLGTDLPLGQFAGDFDLVVLPGGKTGTDNLTQSRGVRALLTDAQGKGKLIAAICAAPSLLGTMGILEGKRATCFPGFEKHLTGAVFTGEKVVKDQNIITAKGMGVADKFGYLLAEVLFGREKSQALQAETQFI